jgi:hypothetical protein
MKRVADAAAILLALRNSWSPIELPRIALAETNSDLKKRPLKPSKVPETRLHRIYEFGTLGLSVGAAMLQESVKRYILMSLLQKGIWIFK